MRRMWVGSNLGCFSFFALLLLQTNHTYTLAAFHAMHGRLYTSLVTYCRQRDSAWENKRVVCRFDDDKLFYEGVVVEQVRRSGRWFRVSLDDGHVIEAQESTHLLSHDRNGEGDHVLVAGDAVIALYYQGEAGDDYEHCIFAPAKVRQVRWHAICFGRFEFCSLLLLALPLLCLRLWLHTHTHTHTYTHHTHTHTHIHTNTPQVEMTSLQGITVRFYDGKRCQLRRRHCYHVATDYHALSCEALRE